ncbi:MAG TPA: ABC transporter substrate-binding protein [Chloroflexota bacterium]|nr:ABC transporter substrate-binding protein [Chloroflexota bacterium]
MNSASRRARLVRIAGVVALSIPLFLTASAAHATTHTNAVKQGGTVTLVTGPQTSFTRNFNPFNGNAVSTGDLGFIYEPLVYYNLLKAGKASPWLATSWAFSNHNRTLTFQLRKGVKWSNGKPFTSADVVFDAKYAMSNPVADTAGMTPYVKSVKARGAYTVVFTFRQVNTTMLYYIGNQMRIVPKFQWKGKDPTKFTDPNPIGTGPFRLGAFSPQQYTFVRNPNYWKQGEPHINAIRFPLYTSNDSATAAIVSGQVDWSNVFIPNAQKTLVAKGHGNAFWYYPADHVVTLFMNLTEAPFNNVWVRRAMSEVINRDQVWKVGEYGYEPPSNAAFIQPQFRSVWGNTKAMGMVKPGGSLAAAKADMAKAGNVDLSKTFNIEVPTGWTDWDTSVQLIVNDLAKIGIKAKEDQVSFPNPYLSDQQNGTFDMSFMWTNAGPSPYNIYHDAFWSKQSAPIGKPAVSNYERYHNPTLDNLIRAYTKTANVKQQIAIMRKMEALVANQVPAIPVVTGAYWYTYNTSRFAGWPSQHDPYDLGAPAYFDQNLNVALHLHLK